MSLGICQRAAWVYLERTETGRRMARLSAVAAGDQGQLLRIAWGDGWKGGSLLTTFARLRLDRCISNMEILYRKTTTNGQNNHTGPPFGLPRGNINPV